MYYPTFWSTLLYLGWQIQPWQSLCWNGTPKHQTYMHVQKYMYFHVCKLYYPGINLSFGNSSASLIHGHSQVTKHEWQITLWHWLAFLEKLLLTAKDLKSSLPLRYLLSFHTCSKFPFRDWYHFSWAFCSFSSNKFACCWGIAAVAIEPWLGLLPALHSFVLPVYMCIVLLSNLARSFNKIIYAYKLKVTACVRYVIMS